MSGSPQELSWTAKKWRFGGLLLMPDKLPQLTQILEFFHFSSNYKRAALIFENFSILKFLDTRPIPLPRGDTYFQVFDTEYS